MAAPTRPPIYAWPIGGIEESSAEAAGDLAKTLVSYVAMYGDWILNDGISGQVTVAAPLTLRFVFGANSLELRLSVGPSNWIELDGILGDDVRFRGFVERQYEEFQIWPPGAGKADGEAPGRVGKRGNWINMSVAAWASLESVALSSEWLVLEARDTVSSAGRESL